MEHFVGDGGTSVPAKWASMSRSSGEGMIDRCLDQRVPPVWRETSLEGRSSQPGDMESVVGVERYVEGIRRFGKPCQFSPKDGNGREKP